MRSLSTGDRSDEIDRPVFVIGTGRCGLTPLMHAVALHEDFAWPSQYNNRWPDQFWLSRLSRIAEWPLFRSSIKYQWYFPRHTETYNLWDHQYLGFSKCFRDLTEADVTPWAKANFRHVAAEVMRHQGKRRFITEYSGWSRIGFLRAIFPDAKFIHIVRDGRAVANSLTNVWYWRGWQGIHNWGWGLPTPELQRRVAEYGDSFLALAAIQWKMTVNNITEQCGMLPAGDALTVRYEDLSSDVGGVAEQCIAFAGLQKTKRFESHLGTVFVADANRKTYRIPPWKENLTASQIDMLNDLLRADLERFGYL